MKNKKILAGLLSFAILVSTLVMPIFANDEAGKTEEEKAKAIEAGKLFAEAIYNGESEITLTEDVIITPKGGYFTDTLTFGKDCVVDLAGYNMDYGTLDKFAVGEGVSVKFTSSKKGATFTFEKVGDSLFYLYQTGKLTIENIDFIGATDCYVVNLHDSAVVDIDKCNFNVTGTVIAQNTSNGVVNIEDTKIESTKKAFLHGTYTVGGTSEINGDVAGSINAVYVIGSNVTFSNFEDAKTPNITLTNSESGKVSCYETFDKALAAAKDNDTIEIFGETEVDIADTGVFSINKSITVKGGVFDVSGAKDCYGVFGISGKDVEVTFKNAKFIGSDYESGMGVFYVTGGAEVTVESSEFNLSNDKHEWGGVFKGFGVADATINIKNCTMQLTNIQRIAAVATFNVSDTKINATCDDDNFRNHAFREFYGTVSNSEITVTGFQNGINNDSENSLEIKENSVIKISGSLGEKTESEEEGEKRTPGYDLMLKNSSEIKIDDSSVLTSETVYQPDEGAVGGVIKLGDENGEYKTVDKAYTVTFELNGGTGLKAKMYESDTTVDLRKINPVKSGYTFDGWFTEEECDNCVQEITLDSDKTLYAKWAVKTSGKKGSSGASREYTVKFNANGGSKVKSQNVLKNNLITEPEAPTKNGFTFGGWYTDKELTKAYDFDTKVNSGFTIYAKWNEMLDETTETENDEKEENKEDSIKEWTSPFTDVNENDWYYEGVRYVTERKLMNGVSDKEFAPNEGFTRAMLVTVLYRAENEPDVEEGITFSDIDAEAYYKDVVIWAKKSEIVTGVSEIEFAPDKNITREDIAVILLRYASFKGFAEEKGETVIEKFADYEMISDYARDAVSWAVNIGLMQGKTENTLNPKDSATRAEITLMLQRFIEINNK